MNTVVPLYRIMYVLFIEDDWVIRQILVEHFDSRDDCRVANFPDADQALHYLQRQCGADRIFSNVGVRARGGIDMAGGSGFVNRLELAVAPGYDAERERFRALDAGRSSFRIKRYAFPDLQQALQHTRCRSSCR